MSIPGLPVGRTIQSKRVCDLSWKQCLIFRGEATFELLRHQEWLVCVATLGACTAKEACLPIYGLKGVMMCQTFQVVDIVMDSEDDKMIPL